jgi:hypothetical protein
MKLTHDELRGGIERLCDASGLNLASGWVEMALAKYDAEPHIENSFAAFSADPYAKRVSPLHAHSAATVFRDRFNRDYGLLRDSKKKLVAERKWHLLASILVGEADCELVKAHHAAILGPEGSEKRAKSEKWFYNFRKSLYLHEDFVIPAVSNPAQKAELSRKYIGNFDYCSSHQPGSEPSGFYESIEAAVTLCGVYFNVVEHMLNYGKPDLAYAREFVHAVASAVSRADSKKSVEQASAIRRLHGLITKSAAVLDERMGRNAADLCEQLDSFQSVLRTKEFPGQRSPAKLRRRRRRRR